jgi:Flp pilus assembly CpaF family ATPase
MSRDALTLVRDPSVTEVMVNGPDAVFVERETRRCR